MSDAAQLDPFGGLGDPGDALSERVLNQDEIDSLLGFDLGDDDGAERSGIRAIINSALVSYERLPMLEIVFDRLVRLMTTSLRNFTSDNVEVSLDNISSIRFGDYLNSIPLPAILAVFRAEELDNYGLLTVDSNLIYSLALFGGQLAFGVQGEGPVAGVGLAVRPVAHGEEGAFARDGEVQAAARLLHRPLAEVAAHAVVQHEAGRGLDRIVAGALAHLGADHQLLDLEAGGVGVGDVVGHDIQFATQRHLP